MRHAENQPPRVFQRMFQKQKRQLTRAVFFVVRVAIQHLLKTIVVQFVFEVIG